MPASLPAWEPVFFAGGAPFSRSLFAAGDGPKKRVLYTQQKLPAPTTTKTSATVHPQQQKDAPRTRSKRASTTKKQQLLPCLRVCICIHGWISLSMCVCMYVTVCIYLSIRLSMYLSIYAVMGFPVKMPPPNFTSRLEPPIAEGLTP